MAMKVFIPFKKKPFVQPACDMCLTTAVKIAVDNQFTKGFSLKDINKSVRYEGKYQFGVSLDNFFEQNLDKLLNKLDIKCNFRENLKIDDLFKLLEQGTYPIVLFPLSKYNEWKKQTDEREVIGDDEPNLHALIVVGIDKEKETIQLFDTIPNKFKKYDNLSNLYDEISFFKFLSMWAVLHDSQKTTQLSLIL